MHFQQLDRILQLDLGADGRAQERRDGQQRDAGQSQQQTERHLGKIGYPGEQRVNCKERIGKRDQRSADQIERTGAVDQQEFRQGQCRHRRVDPQHQLEEQEL